MRDAGAVAETTHGAIRGTVVDTPYGAVRQFLGIPYGKPPAGERRFCAPEAAEPWEGVLDAGVFGPDPIQSVDGPYTGVIPGTSTNSVSEDCLTLILATGRMAEATHHVERALRLDATHEEARKYAALIERGAP